MYKIVIIPLVVGLLVQIFKFAIKIAKGKRGSFSLLFDYGGVPSTHTAFSLSVLILVGLYEGVFTVAFGIAMVFTILILRDALGIRKSLDNHAKAINQLTEQLPNGLKNGLADQKEHIGHTPLEVVLGAVLGGALTVSLYWLLP